MPISPMRAITTRSRRRRHCAVAISAFLAAPDDGSLGAAKAAWIAARVPYQQTEAFRFGNGIVDDWEGKVNAWPLDEGLIDYVAGDYGTESDENAFYTANVIANRSIKVGGRTLDVSKITKELLAEGLHELEGIEANVATGYHAIEFLLWGQDLNGTGPGAGARPPTDFSTSACTGGNCDRRAAYLKAATDLLIDDLTWITAQWAPGGKARATLHGWRQRRRSHRHLHRSRQHVLWRAGRRTHEARALDPRSRRRA